MRKMIFVLIALLLLTACGATPPAAPVTETPQTESDTPAPKTEAVVNETSAPAEAAAPVEEPAHAEAPIVGETVTLDGQGSYLRLTLPAGWNAVPGENSAAQQSLLLLAPSKDGFCIELNWWESFGMCGTGVSFEELALPNGLTATLATEETQDEVWWTLILPPAPSNFTLRITAPRSVIDAHQAELDAILASIEIGELSELPPQPVLGA